ncbi:hypothetical protein C1192_00815 [Escherichia marmotae]|nr:hypothetical protein C1192_00815 [Escherichia marmotae]
MLIVSHKINNIIIPRHLSLFVINFVLFADYLYKKMPHVHLFPIVQKDKYHWGRENHLSGNSLEFRSIPFILPYHFEKF